MLHFHVSPKFDDNDYIKKKLIMFVLFSQTNSDIQKRNSKLNSKYKFHCPIGKGNWQIEKGNSVRYEEWKARKIRIQIIYITNGVLIKIY